MMSIIKHLKQFNRQPIEFIEQLQRNYGDVASIRLAHKRFHFIFNANDIQTILSQRKHNYCKSRLIFNKIQAVTGKEGLVQLNGALGSLTRKTTNPLFYKTSLDSYLPILEHYTNKLCEQLSHTTAIDIHPLMVSYALNSAIQIITGNNNQQLTEMLAHSFIELNRICGQLIRQPINMHKVLPTTTRKQLHYHKAIVNHCIDQMIEQADLSDDNLITALLNSNETKCQQKQFIRDQVRTFVFAGFETTAASLSFCFYLLAKHTTAQDTLRDSLINHRCSSIEGINKLRYARACYQEALRRYPPAWILAREACVTHQLNHIRIKKNDQIILCIKHVQNSTQYWEDPSAFNPGRFLHQKRLKNRFSYLPFGCGERICSGMQLAFVEASYVMMRLFSTFEFTLSNNTSLPLQAMITLHPAKPIMLNVKTIS